MRPGILPGLALAAAMIAFDETYMYFKKVREISSVDLGNSQLTGTCFRATPHGERTTDGGGEEMRSSH